MQIYDFIGIKNQSITGVKNPLLTIEGTCSKKNVSFIVLEDGEEIDFSKYDPGYEDGFGIKAVLNVDSKYIKVYALDGDKRYLIFNSKMSMLNRLAHKLETSVSSIYTLLKAFFITLGKGIKYFWKEYHFLVPPSLWGKFFKDFIHRVKVRGVKNYYEPYNISEYNKWIEKYEGKTEYEELDYKPLISILIPVYNIDRESLSECLESILKQHYENFEVCLVDDCSTKEETKEVLKEYEEKDKRIRVKYRTENGHISRTTNDALAMAKGEFISLVDDDDVLTEDALYCVVKALNDNKNLDFIYSDEDKLDLNGVRCNPNFKPDFSPDTFLSMNYICHLTTIRKSIVEKIGGFRVGYEGAQDYDLFLRATEQTNNIYHIPRILYHWRMVEGSTSMVIDNKSYAITAGKKSIEDALERRGIKGHVETNELGAFYNVYYDYDKEPMVSIIIPTRDYADTTRTCLESLYEKTTYKNFEVILMNNNSEKEETFKLFDEYKNKYDNFRVIDANYEFNYSKINNQAVKESKGEYICLLNNDTEIIEPNWLSYMVGFAMQDHIGTVGAKLLYPDDTIQHGGVVLGFGVATHAFIGESKEYFGDNCRLVVPFDFAANTAACLVISKKKYNEVGGLEEELHVAYNDIDFNLKLLDKGYYNVLCPMSTLYHFESKTRGYDTTPEKYARWKTESAYMLNKWSKYIDRDPFYNPNFSKEIFFKLDK